MTLSLKLFDGPRDGAVVPVTQAAWPPAEVLPAEGGVYVLSMYFDDWRGDTVIYGYADYQWIKDGAA